MSRLSCRATTGQQADEKEGADCTADRDIALIPTNDVKTENGAHNNSGYGLLSYSLLMGVNLSSLFIMKSLALTHIHASVNYRQTQHDQSVRCVTI